MALPQIQTPDTLLNRIQSLWAGIIEPFLNNPTNKGQLVSGVVLAVGSNTISHGLGRPLQGWKVVRINAVATLYDTQASNATPESTLLLTSSAVATITLEVF